MQVISSRFIITSVRNSALENNRTLMAELAKQIDSYIESMIHISGTVIDDEDAREFLKSEVPDEASRNMIQGRFAAYIEARNDISSIVLFRGDGDAVSGDKTDPGEFSDYTKSDWYRNALKAEGKRLLPLLMYRTWFPVIIHGWYP